MKNNKKNRRFSAVDSLPKSDEKAKQEALDKVNTKKLYKKKAFQVLKGANAIYNAGGDTYKTSLTAVNTTLGLVGKLDKPKRWYQKIWSGFIKAGTYFVKAATGNVANIIMATVALVTATVGTAGIVPIVAGAIALTLTLAKVGIAVKKAIDTRKLSKEYEALVNYANQLVVRNKLLALEPKLKAVEGDLYKMSENTQTDQSKSKQELKFSYFTRIAEKIIDISDRTVGTTAKVLTNPIHATTLIATAVGKFAKDTIIDELTRSPEIREELIKLINNERQFSHYNNIQELQEHTDKLKIDNQALKASIMMDKPKNSVEVLTQTKVNYLPLNNLSEEEIRQRFQDKRSEQEMITSQAQYKKEGRIKRILKGVLSALNPFSEVIVQKHAGLVMATRNEEAALQIAKDIVPRKQRTQSMSVSSDRQAAAALLKIKLDYIKNSMSKQINTVHPEQEHVTQHESRKDSTRHLIV